MPADVIQLPRPRQVRPGGAQLAFFVHVGRNDHREMLDLLSTGEQGIFGFVIEAQYVERHRELMIEARRRDLDLILDPKTQPMGFPDGHTRALANLPWGNDQHHTIADFVSGEGRARAEKIVTFALKHGFTQTLGPTHLLSGPNDPWMRRDIDMMIWTADQIAANGNQLGLIYQLSLPVEVLRKCAERQAVIAALGDAPCNAVWLKTENFGDDATGEKTAAYIEACRDFHLLGLPIVADHVGGLPGLGALAFGAVGGFAHGVTVHQNFKAANWRRPPMPGHGGAARRVYIPQLDMMLKPVVAEAFLGASTRVRGRYGCRDTHCCPHGIRDMIGHPARHALYQQAREVEEVGNTPQSVRVTRYLDERVRRVSDNVAAAAALSGLDEVLQKRLLKKQADVGRFRQAVAHLAEASPSESIAYPPPRRASRESHKN